jgi:hypothetical protein
VAKLVRKEGKEPLGVGIKLKDFVYVCVKYD